MTADDSIRASVEGVALLQAALGTGDPAVLDQAISLLRRSLDDTTTDDSTRARRWNNLGTAYYEVFEQTRTRQALDAALAAREMSVALTPRTSGALAQRLSALAGCLRARFELRGDPADVDRAVGLARQAVSASSDRVDSRAGARASLANTLRVRYERFGVDSDLDESIVEGRLAVADSDPGTERWAGRLTNLSISLRDRYLQRGNDADVDEAVTASGAGLSAPDTNARSRAQRLTNHALALRTRHIRSGKGGGLAGVGNPGTSADLHDIDAAVDCLKEAVDLPTPDNTGFRRSRLAAALLTRFQASLVRADLVQAVHYAREAVRDADLDDMAMDSPLNHLMYALTQAAAVDNDADAADEAVDTAARLLARTTGTSANRALYLTNTGLAYRACHEITGDTDALRAAVELWRAATTTKTSVTAERYNAASHWALYANAIMPGSPVALEGFGHLVELLPILAWRGIARSSRERFLRHVAGVGGQAVAGGLAGRRHDLALRFSEGSRAVLWSQALDIRADLAALAERKPAVALRLGQIRSALDSAG